MRMGIGLGIFSFLGIILNILTIPLDWKIYLLLSAAFPVYIFFKSIKEKTLKLEDIYKADEAFFTGTAAEVTAIEELDDKKIGKVAPGPITIKLRDLFMDIVHGKNEKYKSWLTYVNE